MKLIDMTGERFGRLVVIGRAPNGNRGKVYWRCLCDCGSEVSVRGDHLRYGFVKSCGCYNSEYVTETHTTHGCYHTRLYKVYRTMLARCFNPKNDGFKNYGGRGITVCDEWRKDFLSFREWALENGYDDSASFGYCTIDRIDVNGNYEPGNCRWVTMAVQQKNKRPRGRKSEKSC